MLLANRTVMQHLGETVTYLPMAGGSIVISALITESAQNDPSGYASATWMQHISVEMLVSDVAAPVRGDRIVTAQNVTYTVDAVTANDGYTVTCAVV